MMSLWDALLMNMIISYQDLVRTFPNPDQLKYTPPETKGAVIATLIDQNWADWLDPRNQNNDFFPLTAGSSVL